MPPKGRGGGRGAGSSASPTPATQDSLVREFCAITGADAALAEALDVPKGPLIGGLMAAQREWQLAQPAGDKDACLAYLRSRVDDLRQTHGQGRRGGKSKKARR